MLRPDQGVARAFIYTWHLPNQDNGPDARRGEVPVVFQLTEQGRQDIQWINGQLEHCPDTGRLHHQFYVEFKRPVRGSTLSALL